MPNQAMCANPNLDQGWVADHPEWVVAARKAEEKVRGFSTGRRQTDKSELYFYFISTGGTGDWPVVPAGTFAGKQGVRVFVIDETVKDEDRVTPLPGDALLIVKLQPEELELTGLGGAVGQDGYAMVVVPDDIAVWCCTPLAFDKKCLELSTPVRRGCLEHDDAEDLFAKLVWVGTADNDEKFAAKLVWLALLGIRGANNPEKFGPSILAPVQDPQYSVKDDWHTHPVWEMLQRQRDTRVTGRGTWNDGGTIHDGQSAIDAFQDAIVNYLWSIADHCYVGQKLEPRWTDRRLDHKDVSKAVDDRVWLYDPNRPALIRHWRERADTCILRTLEKKGPRGDFGRSDATRALSVDLLFQWMRENRRLEAEAGLLKRADFADRRMLARLGRERMVSPKDAANLIARGAGQGWTDPSEQWKNSQEWAHHLVVLTWKLASVGTSGGFMRRQLVPGDPGTGQEIHEAAEKAYIGGDLAPDHWSKVDDSMEGKMESDFDSNVYVGLDEAVEDELRKILGPDYDPEEARHV